MNGECRGCSEQNMKLSHGRVVCGGGHGEVTRRVCVRAVVWCECVYMCVCMYMCVYAVGVFVCGCKVCGVCVGNAALSIKLPAPLEYCTRRWADEVLDEQQCLGLDPWVTLPT